MFREAPAGAYLVIVEDIIADPPAEQLQRRAVQEIERPQQQHQAPEGGLCHLCVVCLDAEATFIAFFCCHLLVCADCVQALRINGVGTCVICREAVIYFLRISMT